MDVLKIDRSFTRDACDDSALLEAIVAMGESLGLVLIPEGIEEPEQADALRALGCRLGQGFLFGRPVPAEELVGVALRARGLALDPERPAFAGLLRQPPPDRRTAEGRLPGVGELDRERGRAAKGRRQLDLDRPAAPPRVRARGRGRLAVGDLGADAGAGRPGDRSAERQRRPAPPRARDAEARRVGGRAGPAG